MASQSRSEARGVDLDAVPPPEPVADLPLPLPAPKSRELPSEIAARSVISHLRYVALAVPDFAKSRRFYEEIWGLYPVVEDGNVAFLGAIGTPEPFILRLREASECRTDVVSFGATDVAGVDRLATELARDGVTLIGEPAVLDAPGAGYGFRFFDPDGRLIEVAADVAAKPYRVLEERESVPRKISHVVFNTPDVVALMKFYEHYLGFRLSDWLEDMMCFLRCSEEHHTLAIAQLPTASLNHVSFEMRGIDEYMRATGRVIRAGHSPLWGPGRHSAGDNVYSYFSDPDRNVVEYTTELERIPDEDAWIPRVWSATNEYADRWGTGGTGMELFAHGAASGADRGLWQPSPL